MTPLKSSCRWGASASTSAPAQHFIRSWQKLGVDIILTTTHLSKLSRTPAVRNRSSNSGVASARGERGIKERYAPRLLRQSIRRCPCASLFRDDNGISRVTWLSLDQCNISGSAVTCAAKALGLTCAERDRTLIAI